MLEALKTPAVPDPAGDNLPDRGPFGFVHDAFAGVRDRFDAYSRQFHGEGRREENVPELPWNVQIGGKDTWVGAKMSLGRDNDRAMDDIALAQLRGGEFRRDKWGNLIVKLPEGAQVAGQTASGQEFYPNRPGFSQQDLANFVVDQIPNAAGAAVGGSIYAATKNGGRALATGAATRAGANLLLDELAQRAGSRQSIDWQRAADDGLDGLHPSWRHILDFIRKP